MNNFGCGLAFLAILAVIFSYTDANAIDRELVPVMEMDESDYVMDLLGKLERAVVRQNHYQDLLRHPSMKRGLDLGLNRGFSGSQAAKHLMGLAAANFAGGPGRRRRSIGSGAAP